MRLSSLVVIAVMSTMPVTAFAQANSDANAEMVRKFYAEPKFGEWKDAIKGWGPYVMSDLRTGFGGPTSPDRMAQHYAVLGELDATCKAKYAGMVDPSKYSDWSVRPGSWCEVATKRDEIAKKIIANNTKALIDDAIKTADALLQPEVKTVHVVAGSWYKDLYAPNSGSVKGIAFSTKTFAIINSGGKDAVAALRGEIEAWTKPLGATPDAAITTQVDDYEKKLAGVKAALDAALPAPVFVAKAKDAKMEAAGKKGIDGKILKSAVMTSKWITTISQASKKPIDRVKIGTIFYKKGDYCIYRSYSYKQYAKNGVFSGEGKVADYADWLMRCK